MNDIQKTIILNKCAEMERHGYHSLKDSDITEILEECERQNQPLSRDEVDMLFEEKPPITSITSIKEVNPHIFLNTRTYVTAKDISNVPLWIYKYVMDDNEVIKMKLYGTKAATTYRLMLADKDGHVIDLTKFNNGWQIKCGDINKEYMQLKRLLILSREDDEFAYNHFGKILGNELAKATKKANEMQTRITEFCQHQSEAPEMPVNESES